MKNIKLLLICMFIFISCKQENPNPAFRFSNFYETPAENLARAIEKNDVEAIREEVINKQVNVDYKDEKYEVPLLELAIANYKKEAFEELLRLGADPNIENSSCVSPLVLAIRHNRKCDLYFVKRLLDNNADITPELFNRCSMFTHDPICETILFYNDENKINGGLEILKVLTTRLDNPNLLSLYNNQGDYHENIVYYCLSTSKNLSALKYLIVDLKFKVPEEIFIDGTVILNYQGYKPLDKILESREFSFNESDEILEKAKNDILNYLKSNYK